ncbi:MAG TPA: hypothetical protein VNO31_43015 [Umezawaea sp.]|nr:hypothetical protein [Umezawaea sp.]
MAWTRCDRTPTAKTSRGVQRAHVTSIAWENLLEDDDAKTITTTLGG